MEDRSPGSLVKLVLEDRRIPYLLSAILAVTGFVLASSDYTLNDEGLFTFMTAAQMRQAFSAVFFFQKAKPVLSLLYLWPVGQGLTFFFFLHVLVASSAPPLAAAIARALGIGAPNVSAFV